MLPQVPNLEGITVTHIGILVKDLRAAVKSYHELLGWGPWKGYVLAPPRLYNTTVHGKPVEYSMQIAEAHVGPIDIELIEPLEGPSIYKEWLDKHGEGVHHIACKLAGTYEQNLAYFEKHGMNVQMGGSVDNVHFYYLGSEPKLKIILESDNAEVMSSKPDWVYPEPSE